MPLLDLATFLVWPLIISLPLVLTYHDNYKSLFPEYMINETPRDFWYESNGEWPSPVGLSLGIAAVIVGQFFILVYFFVWQAGHFGQLTPIQQVGPPEYSLIDGLKSHLGQPEGFVMLGGYLILTWMFGLMPASYYSFSGGINFWHVAAQILLTDFLQYIMHKLEHVLDKRIYRASHKPHHRFTNPKIFDAFNGSPADTFLMILVPLAITARCVPANVWSYMTFGALFSNWLVLIHAEYRHPWDRLFRRLGFGTAADHHVHHKLFVYNYGHLFMYWDRLLGTYRDPCEVGHFNKHV